MPFLKNPKYPYEWQTYVHFGEKVPDPVPLAEFHAWGSKREEEKDMVAGMALRRAIRMRGGVRPGEHLAVWVLMIRPNAPRHENGRPMVMQTIKFMVHGDA